MVAAKVEHVYLVATRGDQAGCPRLGGGTRAPVTAGGKGSVPGFWGEGRVAGDLMLSHDQHLQGVLARSMFSSATTMALTESMSSWSFIVGSGS